MYKLTNYGSIVLDGNVFIPFEPANIDYQQYLAWLAEGNTPEPVDPPTADELAAEAQRVADAAAKAGAKADTVVEYLRDHTPAEVDTYILNAVADLPPSAKQMFRKMGLMLCLLSKQSLR